MLLSAKMMTERVEKDGVRTKSMTAVPMVPELKACAQHRANTERGTGNQSHARRMLAATSSSIPASRGTRCPSVSSHSTPARHAASMP